MLVHQMRHGKSHTAPGGGNRAGAEIGRGRKSGTDHVFHFRSPETVVCLLFPGMINLQDLRCVPIEFLV